MALLASRERVCAATGPAPRVELSGTGEIYFGCRRRVLFLSEDMLWPSIGGGRIRCINLLIRALEFVQVDLIVVAPEADVVRDTSEIPDLPGLTTHVFIDEARSSLVPRRLSPAATALARTMAQEHGGYDAVHLEGHFLWPVLPSEIRSRTVVVEQNIESLVLEQRRLIGEEVEVDDIERLRTAEQHVWRQAGAVVALTPEDAAEITSREPSVVPHLVLNGWDHLPERSAPRYDGNGRLASPRLLFYADYDFIANVDSLRWLLADIFPRIRERIPGAVLLVGGINMSTEHERIIRSCPGARVLGFIDDLVNELDRADIVVCPLRWGGGVKVKVIEALRRACLLVSTTTGGTGIPCELRSAGCFADDAAKFADHVTRLCNDPRERQWRRRQLVANRHVAPTWEDSSIRTMRLWSHVSSEVDLLVSDSIAID